jgi:hypothetical protein
MELLSPECFSFLGELYIELMKTASAKMCVEARLGLALLPTEKRLKNP